MGSPQSFPLQFEERRPKARRFIPLLVIDFGTEVYRSSFLGVSTPTTFYKPTLLSVSDIVREVPILPGLYSVGQGTAEISNTDRHFSQLKAETSFRGREVALQYGEPYYGVRGDRKSDVQG